MSDETTIRDDVIEVLRSAGFDVREGAEQFAVSGTIDSGALLIENLMSHSDEKIAKAKNLNYQKGYQAGKARKHRDIAAQQKYDRDTAFLDRAYLALLPAAMAAQGWTIGEEKITSSQQRIKLAVMWAREALRQRPLP